MLGLFCFVRLTCFSFLTSLGKHRFLRKSNITGAWRFSFDFSLPFLLQTCFLFILKSNISAMRFIYHQTSFHVAKIWPCATVWYNVCGRAPFLWKRKDVVWQDICRERKSPLFCVFFLLEYVLIWPQVSCHESINLSESWLRREELERTLRGRRKPGGVLPIYTCNLKGKGLAALTSPHSRAHSIGSLGKL